MLRLMNLPVLLALTVQALFSLCGHVTCPTLSAAGLSVWKDGVVFAILIVVLLVKPTGLLGKPVIEKV